MKGTAFMRKLAWTLLNPVKWQLKNSIVSGESLLPTEISPDDFANSPGGAQWHAVACRN